MHTIKRKSTKKGEGDEEMAAALSKWIHMVGIAGAGMSGIARVLSEKGFKVSGSDLQTNNITDKLQELGIEIYQGHSSSNLKEGVDLLVISSAIPQDNTEVILARKRNIPVIKRGQMLAELFNANKGIAVSGAHGKTTTTSMMCTVLADCGLDPTFFIGGQFQGNRPGARLGTGEYSVAEADESDASFLELNPYIAVVTNIEDDHLDYYQSFENIQKAFKQFLTQVKPDGFAVVYGDDTCIKKLIPETGTKIITYGEAESNDYYIKHWDAKGMGSTFAVYSKGEYLTNIELSVPGKHNALNSLTTIVLGLEIGLSIEKIKQALKKFTGTKRRFEIIGKNGNITVVDDYAHHPSEIKATIDAAKNFHKGRLVVIFQPHRYTRTKLLGKQLGEAFARADLVVFTEIYAAGEKSIPGINGRLVYNAARNAGCNAVYIPVFNKIDEYIIKHIHENDLIITMGAGDIWKTGISMLSKIPQSILEA